MSQLSTIPPELQTLYNTLYAKISTMIGGKVLDLKSDPNTLRILIESTMTIVENFKNEDGKGWSGPEKKRIALSLIHYIIHDLAVNGKIDPTVAAEINANIDFFGGIVMDVAIAAAKKAFDVGENFIQDAKKTGCKASCRKNCCFGF